MCTEHFSCKVEPKIKHLYNLVVKYEVCPSRAITYKQFQSIPSSSLTYRNLIPSQVFARTRSLDWLRCKEFNCFGVDGFFFLIHLGILQSYIMRSLRDQIKIFCLIIYLIYFC